MQLCSEEAAGTGTCGQRQAGGSLGAPSAGCTRVSCSWPAARPAGCWPSTRTPPGVFGGGGSRQAKYVSFHFGLFFFEKKSSSHVSWAPRLQITLPLLGWEFQRILISNGWLRKSFGKSVAPLSPMSLAALSFAHAGTEWPPRALALPCSQQQPPVCRAGRRTCRVGQSCWWTGQPVLFQGLLLTSG